MANNLLAYCGFGIGGVANVGGYQLSGVGGTFSFETSIIRSGLITFRTNPLTTAVGWGSFRNHGVGSTSAFNIATIFTDYWVYIVTLPVSNSEELFVVNDTSPARKMSVRVDSTGKFQAYDKTGTNAIGSLSTTALSLNTWYHFGVKTGTGASAAWEVKLNTNVEILNGTADLGALNCNEVVFGKNVNRNGQTVDFIFADCTVDDGDYRDAGTTGYESTGVMRPAGDGYSTQWPGGTGTTSAEVDELPPNDATDYFATTTTPHIHAVTLTSSASVNIVGTVSACVAYARGGWQAAGQTRFLLGLRSSGTNDLSNQNSITQAWVDISFLRKLNSGGGAWGDATNLDSAELVISYTVAGPTVHPRCSTLAMEVLYLPAVIVDGAATLAITTDLVAGGDFAIQLDGAATLGIDMGLGAGGEAFGVGAAVLPISIGLSVAGIGFGRLPLTYVQPTAFMEIDGDSALDRVLLLGGEDGFVRRWDPLAIDDDGLGIDSRVRIMLARDKDTELRVQRIRALLAQGQSGCNLEVFASQTADRHGPHAPGLVEGIARTVIALIAGQNPSLPVCARGAFLSVRLRSFVEGKLTTIVYTGGAGMLPIVGLIVTGVTSGATGVVNELLAPFDATVGTIFVASTNALAFVAGETLIAANWTTPPTISSVTVRGAESGTRWALEEMFAEVDEGGEVRLR